LYKIAYLGNNAADVLKQMPEVKAQRFFARGVGDQDA
jgi:hypothetical protein